MKVIYMSGYGTEIAGSDLKLQEGVNFLQKPFEPRVLSSVLRRCLDGDVKRKPIE